MPVGWGGVEWGVGLGREGKKHLRRKENVTSTKPWMDYH